MARGPFRLHANEHAIGLPLPTWAQVITASVVTGATYVHMMLQARPFSVDEALDLAFVDEVVDAGMAIARAREVAASFAGLSQPAYAHSKLRLRQRDLDWAKALVPKEMAGFPGAR
jgi:enoyl-CoA hydratase/carnithine racemase